MGPVARDPLTNVMVVPGPVALRAVRVGARGRRLFLFQELSANRKTPAETGAMAAEALTYADEPDETSTSTTS